MSFTIDFSDFDKEFKKLDKKMLTTYEDEALFNAATSLKFDADNIDPTTPIGKTGDLRGSVAFEGKTKGQKKTINVVWKMPYAAYQHEGKREDGTHVVMNYTQSGSGSKYASKKLETRGKIYRDIMGMTIKSKS